MFPKDKATELVEKYVDVQKELDETTSFYWDYAKKCAMIAVDELINMAKIYDNHNAKTPLHIYTFHCLLYWEEVKREIINL